MKATLLVFSGRENPVWILTHQEGKKLYEELRTLPGTLHTWTEDPGLGYRGIEVALDAAERMRVYKSYVEVISQTEIRRFMDVNRDLEMWIFSTARDKIGDDIYNQVLVSQFTR